MHRPPASAAHAPGLAQLLYLAQEDPEHEVQMYINSPGSRTGGAPRRRATTA